MSTKVHNVLFYKPKSNAISCMCFNQFSSKLALSRSNSSIEIWNLKDSPFIERIIPALQEENAIQGLAWYRNQLFSVDLEGFLIEYDLFLLASKQRLSVTGGQAYSVDICNSNSTIAVGTEQGFLNVFILKEDEIYFTKFMDKQESRILSLKFAPSGKIIVSGSVDIIQVFDVLTGRTLNRITFGRAESKLETLVWCLHVFSDLSIVSGDSRGKLTFWDGQTGSQLETYQSHKASILSLCVSDDEKTLYCSGVDPTIIMYMAVNAKDQKRKWVKSIQRKVHDHDVNGLILQDGKLYSGSIDGYLACTYYPPKTLMKYPPLLNDCGSVCSSAKLLLLRYSQHLEVWTLGNKLDNAETKKLLVLYRSLELSNEVKIKEGVISCAISNDGNWIAMSTSSGTRLHSLEITEQGAKLYHHKNLKPAVKICFANCNLILAACGGNIETYNLDDNISLNQIIDTSSFIHDTVTFLTSSSCGKYLVAADPQSNIVIWKFLKKNSQWKYEHKLPVYNSSPIAVSFRPKSSYISCVYANNKIIEFDLSNKSLTTSSRILEDNILTCFHALTSIRHITFAPDKDAFVLHDDSNIFVINPNKIESPTKHISKKICNGSQTNIDIKTINKFKHIAFAKFWDNDLLIVQVDPAEIYKELPPSLKQNKCFTT